MKIIIVGAGRMGLGLYQKLEKKGHDVVMIDANADLVSRLSKDTKTPLIHGLGFDQATLLKAGVERASAVVACTQCDEANALIARIAKNIYHVPHAIARLYDPNKATIYQKLGIQTISTTIWGIDRTIEMLTYSHLHSVYEIGNGSVNMISLSLPPMLIGNRVQDVSAIGEVQIVSILRKNKAFIPTLGTILEAHDLLYLVVADSALEKLKSIFGLD
ncbi:MAG: potassium channel family protein [Erysipelotrichaceae bacterium]